MNDLEQPRLLEGPPPRPLLPAPDRDAPEPPPSGPPRRGRIGGRLLGLGVLLLFTCGLALGVWRHYEQSRQVMDTAEQQSDFVPSVRVEAVAQRFGNLHVTLPATTLGFEAANIYARASGYVLKRYVDIGDHVKAGQLLAEITAPEVEDQVAQYQNSLQQAHQTQDQNQAQQSLNQVTWGRDSVLVNQGWVTKQQGDVDRYTLQAQQHATQAAQYNAAALQAAEIYEPAKDLSAGCRAVRRRDHPAQHRCRQPDHGRRTRRHLHVLDDPQRRDPGLALCAAGLRLWR